MKRSLKWIAFFVIMLSLTTLLALAAGAETEGDYTYTIENNEATITGVLTSISGDIVVPDTLGGYPVTSIGYAAFRNCTSLQSLKLPSGVTSIGGYAFQACSSLQSIVIPSTVESIGTYAFYNCTVLQSIEIPSTVTSIGTYAFYNCTALQSIELPSGLTSIGSYTFYNCSSLTSIEVPRGVTSIVYDAFKNCSSLTSIIVEEGNSVYHSSGNCLIETASKTLIVGCQTRVIPNDGSVTSIGTYAFYSCTALQSIELSSAVTSIGNYAFNGCSNLQSIELGSSMMSIGKGAFTNCSALQSVEIPITVTEIGYMAFAYCSNLADIYYSGSEEEWNAITKGSSWDKSAGTNTASGAYTLQLNYGAPSEFSDADVIAYQVTKAENGLFSIRAIAGMNSLLYKNFGYEVTITTKDASENDVVQTLSGTGKNVYSSIYGGTTEYSIKDTFGCEYGGLATISDLDISSTYTKIEIRAYVTEADGTQKYGKSATLLYTGTLDADGYPEFTSVIA